MPKRRKQQYVPDLIEEFSRWPSEQVSRIALPPAEEEQELQPKVNVPFETAFERINLAERATVPLDKLKSDGINPLKTDSLRSSEAATSILL
jgi:hypothetical protein